ncbi:cTAGE family member 5 [Cololabis saira]|uniref:cTAGE family member 5 n=1 Tax=Cololabis saira TaxID=129043 RepID=UPI002AD2521A|nr:cTAGE family member 5 [Cololabis saira]
MGVLKAYRFLWIVGTTFWILPHIILGLLSDYKICGDSECQSLMSRVQAMRDHHSKDCRFLSFMRGEIIYVYHKLTGKRDDLWAGSINRQFGYFPKDAVKEEQVYATSEEELMTQESDFFCTDEFGSFIEPTHLDTDDDSEYEIQTKDSETAQELIHSHDDNPEVSLTSEDASSEHSVSAGGGREPVVDAAEPYEKADEIPTDPSEQDGSPSSSWLGTSVTGWLGLASEQPDNSAEGERDDDVKETKDETSPTSSAKPDEAEENEQTDDKKDNSFASTMTGWFSFGGEEKNEQDEVENNEEDEHNVIFRARKMYSSMGSTQLHKEEKKEMGTLEWFGESLSSRVGFGFTKQDPGQETGSEEEKKEESVSNSWMDIGIGDILGFGKENIDVDESERNVAEKDETLEQPVASQSTDPATDEQKTEPRNESHMGDPSKDQRIQSPETINADGNDRIHDHLDALDIMEVDILEVEAEHEVISPHTKSEEISPAVGGVSSTINSFIHTSEVQEVHVEERNDIGKERSLEMEGGHLGMPATSEGSKSEDMEPREEKTNMTGENQDFVTLSDSNVGPGDRFEETSGSSGKSAGKDETDEKDPQNRESVEEDVAAVTHEVYNSAQSTDVLDKSGDYHERVKSKEDTDLPHKEIVMTATEKSAEEDQVGGDVRESSKESLLSSAEKGNEQILVNVSFIPPIAETKVDLDNLAITNDNLDLESHQGKPGKVEESPAMDGSSEELGASHSPSDTEHLYENASEESGGTMSSGESTAITDKEQAVSDADYLGNSGKDLHEKTETESSGFEDVLSQSRLKSPDNYETEIPKMEDVEESKETGMIETIEVKQDGMMEDLKGMGEQQEVSEVEDKGEEQQEEVENKQKENGEFKEKSKETEENSGEVEIPKMEDVEESKEMGMIKTIEVKQDGMMEDLKGMGEQQVKEEWVEDKGEEQQEEMENKQKENGEFKEKSEEMEENSGEVEKEESRGEKKELVMSLKGGGDATEANEEREQRVEELKEKEKQVEKLPGQTIQMRVEDSETFEEVTEKDRKEDEREQLQEVELESDIGSPTMESKEKETPHDNLGSLFTEKTTQKMEQREEKKERVVEVTDEEMESEEVVEKQPIKHVEDDSLKCSGEHCSQEGKGEVVTEEEGDGEGSEDVESSVGEEAAVTGDQNAHKDRTDSSEKTSNNAVRRNGDFEVTKADGKMVGSESRRDGEGEPAASPDEREVFTSEDEDPRGSSNPSGAAESESRGAFSLFQNAFGLLSQTPTSEPEGFVESALKSDINSGETSQLPASLTPDQEVDSTAELHQARETQLATPTEHPEPHSPSTQNPFHAQVTETFLQTKTLTKLYKNLLTHMSVEETSILMEVFGKTKLQFLDYILTSSEALNEITDEDQAILLDIERLLHHYREFSPSMKMDDAPQEDEGKTRTFIALKKLEMLLKTVKETFSTGKSDVSNHQAEPSCAGVSCSTQDKDEEVHIAELPLAQEDKIHRDETMTPEKDSGHVDDGRDKERKSVDEETEEKGYEEERASISQPLQGSLHSQKGVMKQTLDFVYRVAKDSSTHAHALGGKLLRLAVQVVSSLPDDIRPGPDLYGLPWELVIVTGLVGLVTIMLFTWRCYSSIKSRLYQNKEHRMAEQVTQLLDEKCKVLETLSQCQQEYDELETLLKGSGVLAQTEKTEHLEVKARQFEHNKLELERDLQQVKDQMEQQREHKEEQQRRIAMLEETIRAFEEETKDLQSQEEQAQTTLKIYNMNSDRLQRNLETEGEENIVVQESNNHLRQQVEGWAERVSELEAEMQRCEIAHSGMLQDVANKDERIMSLTDRLLRMKAWDSDMGEEEGDEGRQKEATKGTPGKGEENGRRDAKDMHLQKVQKLIYAAKLNADLKSVDEDKDRVFAKLNDEIKAKEELQVSIKDMENEKLSLQSDSEHYTDQAQRLQQKLQIMTEMYQENELKLHRMLTVEEKERHQKEEKLTKADKNIAMAMEELNNYRQRAEEMEEELEKTRKSYQTQISAHEKKAHNNWLAARAAERDLSDIRRENGLFRQKLTDTQFKLDALDKDPYALNSLARPLPFRAERSPYGPSPLGRPPSEPRALLSPPTLMDGPARLSPRVPRGPGDLQGEMERSGGPHSDSGSISPTWERDRRGPPLGPPGPPGYMFPEPGGPMFRRPPPGAMRGMMPPGPLQGRGLPPGPPHPADMSDSSFRENSLGPADPESRVSGPGDQMAPPEPDPRMSGPLPPGAPLGPMDGPGWSGRGPYGPPPRPDFYPPRGPGGPPIMPMWGPRPPGMMFPPRFPPGGPPHPPHPHMSPYGPPGGLPPPDSLPPRPPHPSQLHRKSPEESTPSPEDAI